MKKIFLALPVLLVVGGCNGRQGNDGPSLDVMAEATMPTNAIRADVRPHIISTDAVLVHLPEDAGPTKLARERRHPNGYSQEIILSSDVPSEETRIEIAIQIGRPLASSDKAPVWKPGESGIRDELTRHFPDVRMQVVGNGGYENKYGRFGVAIGRKGDTLRCVYAWQYVDDARRSFEEGNRIPRDGADAAPAALRVKICRADVSIDTLVDYVRRLTVTIPNDFGAPQAVVAPTIFRSAASPASKKHAWRPRHNVVDASQRLAPDAAIAPIYGDQGPRYMAPVAAPAGGSQFGRTGVDPTLPPQAYRGPAAARAPSVPTPISYQRSSNATVDQTPTAAIVAKPVGAPRVVPMNADVESRN